MGRENLVLVAAAGARDDVARARREGLGLGEQFRAAARSVRDHWLVTDDDERFKAAVAALFEQADELGRQRCVGCVTSRR